MVNDVFDTPNVSCMSCAAKIEDALEGLAGIAATDVDIELKQVTVTYSSDVIGQSGIIEVLAQAGYEAVPARTDHK